MSRVDRCHTCEAPPDWRLDRRGDAVVTWACDTHLLTVIMVHQRSGERTELVVKPVEVNWP